MVKVGIIGLGFMGQTHLRCYQKLGAFAQIVAIAERNSKRAKGDFSDTFSNLGDGGLEPLDMNRVIGTSDYRELLANPDVDLVDICVPTSMHLEVAIAAAQSGKHVLCEKPLARTSQDATAIAEAASKSRGFFMPGMCIRFWPQWKWLKEAITDGRYGRVRSAHFTRLATCPPGWYRDGKISGGAALDLHIHDSDFVRHCFGEPKAVTSRGYVGFTGEVDHLLTQYAFDDVPLVVAEGGWSMADGFDFRMRYMVNFENATADYDISRPEPLIVARAGKVEPIACATTDGWFEEIRYLLDCIQNNSRPTVVTADDAARSVRLVEAEVRSVMNLESVTL